MGLARSHFATLGPRPIRKHSQAIMNLRYPSISAATSPVAAHRERCSGTGEDWRLCYGRRHMRRGLFAFAALVATSSVSASVAAAPAAPSGPHPRIFLTGPVLTALTAKSKDAASMTAKAIKTCDSVATSPGDWFDGNGFEWGAGATACGLAWQLTKKPEHAASGIKLLTALLDDKNSLGDGGGGDLVVQQDSGYFIRIYGPYAGLAYDWLHAAPGMDAALKLKAQTRFKAWLDWYGTKGYLKAEPGANYHAGYVLAKTIISIAISGDDAAGATYFTDVVDNIFQTQLITKGLGKGGVLQGGDWAEGWQYGPLSVLSYSLSARALAEQGVSYPEIGTWVNELSLRFFHALTPSRSELYVGGDFDDSGFNAKPNGRVALATLVGPSSNEAASWAAFARKNIGKDKEVLVFVDALAEARGVAPVDLGGPTSSKWYVAGGTRRLYMRSGWETTANWAVFHSSPHQVPDHEHADASNVVFYRGADALVVDPSPYGSLSTITSNALTVESNSVGEEYKPSQSVWSGKAEMPWARAGESGIVAARADLSKAFASSKVASDVPYARREFVFLPEGDVVLLDRARTDDAARGLRVRFHSPAAFTLAAGGATSTIGGSTLRIAAVDVGGQTPTARMSPVGDCYSGATRGNCDKARFASGEYNVRVPGPTSLAVHVLSGTAKGDAPPAVLSIKDPAVDPAKNPTVVGAVITRGTLRSVVVGASAKDGVAGASLTYVAPAGGARNVVFDAPESPAGASTVAAVKEGSACRVTITPASGAGFVGRPVMFTLGSATDPCAILEDKVAPPGVAPLGTGNLPGGNPAGGANGALVAEAEGQHDDCGCRTAGRDSRNAGFGALVAGAFALVVARRRRRRR